MSVARTPEQVHDIFTTAFKSGDLKTLVSLYEPNATLMPQPGVPVSGHEAIGAALGQFLALGGDFVMERPRVLRTETMAVLYAKWKLSARTPDGLPIELSGDTTDVVRLQPDGSWRYVIDNPYGSAGMA